jgi:Fe-S-cluster containining protein
MPAATVTIAFDIEAGDRTISAQASIPDELMRPTDLLPVLFAFDNAMVELAAARAADEGREISCRAGCGTCCRQLVPVSEAEALHLAELVAAMPAARATVIRERFRAAIAALGEDLIGPLRDTRALSGIEDRKRIGMEYFQRGAACPFLEQESCSIHELRPATCREYLVTSPPANCADPAPGSIDPVGFPVKVSSILYCFSDGIGGQATRWLPLVLALEWAVEQSEQPQAAYNGPQMFRNFVAQVGVWQRARQEGNL